MLRTRAVAVALALAALPSVSSAQSQPLPLPRGPRFNVKVDSSPQQAAVYVNDKLYGIQGYTPLTLKLPKGTYRLLLELPSFKNAQVPITVGRNQAFSVTLERAPRPAVLDVRAAADGNAVGALIVVDGTQVGTLPNRVEVGAGNHLVEVSKQGFHGFRESFAVAEGETRTIAVPLAPEIKPGSLIVTADAPGAEVYVDGQRKDTAPTVIGDLPEGAHTVEVRAPNMQPWKQVVNVIAGQQIKVMAQIMPATPPPPATGSLRVVATPEGAQLIVDGEPKGAPGIEIKGLQPGTHVVDVRAQGFSPQRLQVEITAGQVKTILVDLVPAGAAAKTAGLRVISPVTDVEVFLDGASVGRAPIERTDLTPGKHFVVARKAGHADQRVEVDLQAGAMFEVAADLRASGGLRVISNPAGASVLLDGTPAGVTPITLPDVSVGAHVIEVKLKDHVDAKQTVVVEGGQQGIVSADLVPVQKGPSAAEVDRSVREQTSWGAMVLDRGRFTVDAGAGFPYYLFLRLQTGVVRFGPSMGLDLGVVFRTSFIDSQIGLRPRVQLFRKDPFAVAIDVVLMGGGGPTSRNSFTFEIGPTATIAAGQYVHINIKPYLGVWSDQLCPTVNDIKNDDNVTGQVMRPGSGNLYGLGATPPKPSGERPICKKHDRTRTEQVPGAYMLPGYPLAEAMTHKDFGQLDPRERFTTVRFVLQGTIEIAASKNISVWVLLEGAPFQSDRQGFTRAFSDDLFPDIDLEIYGAAGVTGKF